jgi:hypothetical protein
MLELHDGKLSRAVLRGGGGGNAASLPDYSRPSPGKIVKVIVTAAGTGSGNVLIYDNATTNSGTIVGAFPGTIAIGTPMTFYCPVSFGIVVANVANGPALTIAYN